MNGSRRSSEANADASAGSPSVSGGPGCQSRPFPNQRWRGSSAQTCCAFEAAAGVAWLAHGCPPAPDGRGKFVEFFRFNHTFSRPADRKATGVYARAQRLRDCPRVASEIADTTRPRWSNRIFRTAAEEQAEREWAVAQAGEALVVAPRRGPTTALTARSARGRIQPVREFSCLNGG